MSDRDQQIRQKAYELWEAAGKPEGRQGEHWAEAERQLSAQDFPQGDAQATGPRQMQASDNGSVEQVIADVPIVRRKRASPGKKSTANT